MKPVSVALAALLPRLERNVETFLACCSDAGERQEEIDLLHDWFLELCDRPGDPVFLVPQVSPAGEAAMSRAPEQPAVHRSRDTGFRLHLHHPRDFAPQVRLLECGPFIA